jgi:hypothetical protein
MTDLQLSLLLVPFFAVVLAASMVGLFTMDARGKRRNLDRGVAEERDHLGDDVLALFAEDATEDDDFCRCRSCEAGITTEGHCVDIDGSAWHDCAALAEEPAPTLREESIAVPTHPEACYQARRDGRDEDICDLCRPLLVLPKRRAS